MERKGPPCQSLQICYLVPLQSWLEDSCHTVHWGRVLVEDWYFHQLELNRSWREICLLAAMLEVLRRVHCY